MKLERRNPQRLNRGEALRTGWLTRAIRRARALYSTSTPAARLLSLAGLVLLAALTSPHLAQLWAQAVLNNPPVAPIDILVFPQRDFVSASGYNADDLVVVKVIHPNGTTLSTDPANPIIPQADPRAAVGAPFAGIVEVNHPGGACWLNFTPDIRAGDVVQIDIVGGPRTGRSDATTVANVTAGRPAQTAADTVVVHGTAAKADGTQLPLAEVEQRLVANRDLFLLNGRRTLRAPGAGGGDGTLTYDATGSINWTATYRGLQPDDVTRALGSESRMLWLGNGPPVVGVEGTIYENGAGVVAGPAAPCTAPLERIPPPPGSDITPPTTPGGLTASVTNSNTVTLNWTASTDNVGVVDYGIYRDGLPLVAVQNPDGVSAPPTTFIDRNVPPGTYVYTVDAGDALGNRSAPTSPGASVTILSQPPPTLPPNVVANEPPVAPIQIIGFPSRDFISSSGFLATDTVDIQIIRNTGGGPVVVSTSTWTPQPDPRAAPGDPFAGIVEVNHPGGSCWDGVTPELRAGDVIREIAYNPDGTIRTVNQTTVSNVTAFRPVIVTAASSATATDGVIQVRGSAMGKDGKPLPVDQIEQRLVANKDLFAFNGRRTIRAGGAGKDGTLTYDTTNNPTGVNWTATYTGLSSDDVFRAVGGTSLTGRTFPGSESRILWLGSQPLAGLELTIFENSDATIPGPSAGACTGTLEPADTTAPGAPSLNAVQSGANGVQLTWSTPSDNWYVYGYRIIQDGKPITNVGGHITSYLVQNVAPGSHTYSVAAFDSASPRGAGATIIDQLMAGFGQPYGNLSAPSSPVTVNQADVTAPSVPRNLVATAGTGTVSLTWSASTDDVGVVGYGIYRNGTKVGSDVSGSTLSFTDSGLATGTYTYNVDAVDAAGNRSARSATATANVTGVGDAGAPTQPTGVVASVSPDLHGKDVVVTWTASTDNVGVTGYTVYRASISAPVATKIADLNGTTLSFTDANLAAGTYSYTVDASDSAGNRSPQSTAATAVVANDPPPAPHSFIAFPARDFISATGYTPNATYTFTLIRGTRTFVSPPFQADATGLIEVNHPGGTCWNTNTPDMRAGDVIRITNQTTGVADQTTVANVTAQRPIAMSGNMVIVHGTAQDAAGNPLPLEQAESRLIANRDLFDLNGRRTLRAGGAGTDGTFSYDPVDPVSNPRGTNWTATYGPLGSTDVVRAVGGTTATGTVFVGAESRAIWLGRDPVALTESTIFENGSGVVGGPSAPCTAPAETPVAAATFTPTSINFGTVNVSASSTQTVTFSNGGGAPMTITGIYIAGLNPGEFQRDTGGSCPTTFPATLGPGASCTVRVKFSPTVTALRQANLSFSDNAANTTDQTIPLTGTGQDANAPTITVSPTSVTFGTVSVGQAPTRNVTVTNSGTQSLTVTGVSVTGADYTATTGTCAGLAPTASCDVTVQFKPTAIGIRPGTLTINYASTGGPGSSISASTSVSLSGTGAGSVLSFTNNNPVQFGAIDRGRTRDETLTVKNSGTAPAALTLGSFSVSGTGFTLISTTCTTLGVNRTCNVIVRFTPPNAVGVYTGSLSVTAPNAAPATASVSLSASAR